MNTVNIGYTLRKSGFIHCVLSFDTFSKGKKFISTGIRTTPENWDNQTQSIKTNDLENYRKNEDLQKFKSAIENIVFEMKTKGYVISPQSIKDRYKGEKIETFADLAKTFFAHSQSLYEAGKKTFSTLKNMEVKIKTLLAYLELKGKKGLLLVEINNALFDDYIHYLRTVKKFADSTWARHISEIESIIKFAINKGYLATNPIAYYKKPSIKQSEVFFLTADEIELLQKCEPSTEKLEKIRDIFVFQIFTGLSFIDLENAIKGKNTLFENMQSPYQFWLKGQRQKTGVHFLVPILPEAQAIMDKYEGIEKLPIVNNGQYNADLKLLGIETGISPQKMRTHTARRTCGYMLLNNDVPIETVSRVLGHSSIRLTEKIYAKVLDKKIARDFIKFQESQKNNIAQ